MTPIGNPFKHSNFHPDKMWHTCWTGYKRCLSSPERGKPLASASSSAMTQAAARHHTWPSAKHIKTETGFPKSNAVWYRQSRRWVLFSVSESVTCTTTKMGHDRQHHLRFVLGLIVICSLVAVAHQQRVISFKNNLMAVSRCACNLPQPRLIHIGNLIEWKLCFN